MRKTTLFLTLLISFTTFSQSIWKKQADLIKANGIKETYIYQQNPENANQKRLWDWNMFDKEGRLIESKRYLANGKLNTHYRFEYPTNKTRILISVNNRGKEIERIDQNFDLSDEKEPLEEFNKRKTLRYEYDEKGNTTKVWRISENPPLLQTEVFYDSNSLRTKENLLVTKQDGSTYIMTRVYERDESGNILKITSEAEGKVDSIEIHEHKKYST